MKFGNGSTKRRNLVDLMDCYFRLYAPVLTRLLQDFPKASGIETFIGRDDPSALFTDGDENNLSSKTFDKKAAKLLTPLVEATMALQSSCRITEGRDEPVSVSGQRVGEEIAIQVTVSDRLGGIHALRMGQCARRELDAFFLFPAELIVTAGSEDISIIESLQLAAGRGFAEAVLAAAEAKAILNYPAIDPKYDEDFDMWLEEFPRAEGDPASVRKFIAHFPGPVVP
jgi:hypothetical protein